MRSRRLLLLLLAPALSACGTTSSGAAIPTSTSGPLVHLPADQAAHPGAATEWWYVVGHLHGGGHTFGYEATAFQFSHVRVPGAEPGSPSATLFRSDVAITDETGHRFHQKVTYYFPQSASLSAHLLSVHVGTIRLRGPSPRNMSLQASLPGGAFSYHLASQRPAMNVGGRGYLKFAGGYTYYYSLTDLATTGTIKLGSRTFHVTGISWLDHQWGTWSWATVGGWTWMAIQLGNGLQFSLFDVHSSAGPTREASILTPSGRTKSVGGLTITPLATWHSPHTRALYPSGWIVWLPALHAALHVIPAVRDQELVSPSDLRGSYWEGSGYVTGTINGKRVSGRSYTELTGFARSKT